MKHWKWHVFPVDTGHHELEIWTHWFLRYDFVVFAYSMKLFDITNRVTNKLLHIFGILNPPSSKTSIGNLQGSLNQPPPKVRVWFTSYKYERYPQNTAAHRVLEMKMYKVFPQRCSEINQKRLPSHISPTNGWRCGRNIERNLWPWPGLPQCVLGISGPDMVYKCVLWLEDNDLSPVGISICEYLGNGKSQGLGGCQWPINP